MFLGLFKTNLVFTFIGQKGVDLEAGGRLMAGSGDSRSPILALIIKPALPDGRGFPLAANPGEEFRAAPSGLGQPRGPYRAGGAPGPRREAAPLCDSGPTPSLPSSPRQSGAQNSACLADSSPTQGPISWGPQIPQVRSEVWYPA